MDAYAPRVYTQAETEPCSLSIHGIFDELVSRPPVSRLDLTVCTHGDATNLCRIATSVSGEADAGSVS